MTNHDRVQKLLQYRRDHDAWFSNMIVCVQEGKPCPPEPKLESYTESTTPYATEDFVKFCNDVSNAIGPSLSFSNGGLRLSMSNSMLDLYKKYRGSNEG